LTEELKGINTEGFKTEDLDNLNIPAKTKMSELYQSKIPGSCPKCEEIRGVTNHILLLSTPNIMAWKSWGMCEQCYIFQRDNPEEAKKNETEFKRKQKDKKQQETEKQHAHRFRVYILELNTKFPLALYASSIVNIKFTRFPSETSKGPANYSTQLLTEETAKQIVETLQNKDLTCWYDDSEYQKLLKQ